MDNSYLIETLAMVAGFVLSLLVEIPVIKQKYDTFSDLGKRATMTVLLVLAAAGLYGISCSPFLAQLVGRAYITCDEDGLILLIRALGFAVFTNQSTFGLFFRKNKTVTVVYPDQG